MLETWSGFDIPEPRTPIWRYLTLPKFLNLLETGSIFLCRSDRLADLAEGTFPEPELHVWLEVAARNGIDPQKAMLMLQQFYLTRNTMYVNCWHIADAESSVMWNEYVGDVYGVAIESTVERLIQTLSATKEKLCVGQVMYLDYATEQPSPRQWWSLFLTKRRKFAFENELRILLNYMDNVNEIVTLDKLPDPGMYIHIDLERLIQRLVVNKASGSWFVQTVTGLVKKYDLQCEVTGAQF